MDAEGLRGLKTPRRLRKGGLIDQTLLVYIIVLFTSEIFYRVKCDGREGWLNSSYDHREVFESYI